MVKQGDVIYGALSRETFTFLQTAADTDGQLLQIDARIDPGGGAVGNLGAHIHPRAEERFVIHSGEVEFMIRGKRRLYHPGETVSVPAGVSHAFSVKGDGHLHFTLEFAPAMQFETLFESAFAAMRDHPQHFTRKGFPKLPWAALMLHTFPDHTYLAGSPVVPQKLTLAMLAQLGKRLGYRAVYAY